MFGFAGLFYGACFFIFNWSLPEIKIVEKRLDIQMMRGVAVLLVVFFHLDFSLFDRGFLGVDSFFVISGFLMAILYREGMALEFYARRASRLLPAYFFTIIVTIVFSIFITLPSEHSQVVDQGVFAALFSSNVGYWLQNSYFSKSEFNPLLHLWSLGVEIQFYIIVPLLAWMYFKNKFFLLIVFFVSLVAALGVVLVSPKTAFFIMPFRVWQFLFGAAVALYLSKGGAVVFSRPWLGFSALLLMLVTVTLYPVDGEVVNPLMGHPGLASILVTFSTAGVLACGLPGVIESSWLGYILSRLGDWSYSIYLAHFPVIVMMLYVPFSGTILSPSDWGQVCILLLSIVFFSSIIYVFFENRRRWRFSFFSTISVISLTIAFALISTFASGVRYTDRELNILAAFSDRAAYRCGKLVRVLAPRQRLCELTEGLPHGSPVIVLVGDSHADSLKSSFVRVAGERGYRVFFVVSNSPIIANPVSMELLEEIDAVGAGSIVLHFASWNASLVSASDFSKTARSRGYHVVWVSPVPVYAESVPGLVWRRREEGIGISELPTNLEEISELTHAVAADGFSIYRSDAVLCPDGCVLVSEDMRPLYFDASHLTLTGARMMEGMIGSLLDDLPILESS